MAELAFSTTMTFPFVVTVPPSQTTRTRDSNRNPLVSTWPVSASVSRAMALRLRIRLRTVHLEREADIARFVGRDAHDDGLVRIAGENIAFKANVTEAIGRHGGRGIQIQFATVIRHVSLDRRNANAGRRTVDRLFAGRDRSKNCVRVRSDGFLYFSVEKKLANFGEVIVRARAIVIVRETFPERVFIELDAFVKNSAKNHRAHPAIADRQRVGPFFRRLGIPQTQ